MVSAKNSVRILVCVGLCLGLFTVRAQEPVRGIVVDSLTLEALSSVSIQIKNGVRGTTTDDKGNFSLAASPGDTLIFSIVGYKPLELPLLDYEPGIIRMSEQYTLLKAVEIDEYKAGSLYEGMFDERNAALKKSIPFWYSKAKKEKIKLQSLRTENLRVQTYVDVVVNDPSLKNRMMTTYGLSEDRYYDILTSFNEQHYQVMYYLTRAELVSLLNTFFEHHAR